MAVPKPIVIHAHAPLDRVGHGVERLDPAVVGAVGQEHDDVRHVAVGAGLVGFDRVARRLGLGASPTGATSGFASAIASRPFSIAAPMAVPCPVVRHVDRRRRAPCGRSSAERSARRSPRRRRGPSGCPFGCFSTNARAASCATASRLGLTSVEHIDRETSRARMIDVRAIRDARARRAGGRRRAPARRGCGEQQGDRKVPLPALPPRQHRAQERDARVANGLLAPAPQAPPVRPEERGNDEQRQERERPGERHLRSPARTRAIESDRAEREEEPAGGREQRRHLAWLLDGLELEVDRLVDPGQRRGVARLVVGAVGGVGDLLQQVCVECRRDAEAVDLDDGSLLRADADRVDADAGGRRDLGERQRVGARRVLPVGEQDDRRRAEEADVDARRRRSRAPTRRSSAACPRSR